MLLAPWRWIRRIKRGFALLSTLAVLFGVLNSAQVAGALEKHLGLTLQQAAASGSVPLPHPAQVTTSGPLPPPAFEDSMAPLAGSGPLAGLAAKLKAAFSSLF